MNIEEKAKRFDEALRLAKAYHKDKNCFEYLKGVLEHIFPELKESEDERIRKWIIGVLSTYEHDRDLRNAAIAWLEKQGEKKPNPVLDIEIPFGVKDSELQEAYYHIPEGFHAEIDGNRVVIKRGEQKPAWSEEDEDMHYKAMAVINRLYAEGKDYVWSTKTLKKLFYWLKSLKDRHTWNPSDEQMEALKGVVQEGVFRFGILESLYQDLKKLKGE